MYALRKLAVAAVLGLLLCGCASHPTPEALAANDPFEPTNRDTFKLNAKLDKYFVIPTVGAYIYVVPAWGRTRVHDLLDNLSLPITFANDMMQGEVTLGGQTLKRFMLNSTMGVGGLFDPVVGEVHEMLYQNDAPYLFDSSKFARAFGFAGTPYRESIAATAAAYKSAPQ